MDLFEPEFQGAFGTNIRKPHQKRILNRISSDLQAKIQFRNPVYSPDRCFFCLKLFNCNAVF